LECDGGVGPGDGVGDPGFWEVDARSVGVIVGA